MPGLVDNDGDAEVGEVIEELLFLRLLVGNELAVSSSAFAASDEGPDGVILLDGAKVLV